WPGSPSVEINAGSAWDLLHSLCLSTSQPWTKLLRSDDPANAHPSCASFSRSRAFPGPDGKTKSSWEPAATSTVCVQTAIYEVLWLPFFLGYAQFPGTFF